jgi:hypothetical protein
MARRPAPDFDPSSGAYRILGDHPGVEQPGVTRGKPLAVEWYDRTFASRRTTVTRIRGKVRPKVVTESEGIEVTVGLALGGAALLLAWETGQSIAHGLAGLNPTNWAADIEAYVTGKPQPGNIAQNSVGGFLVAQVMSVLEPAPVADPPPLPPPSQPSLPPVVARSGSGSGSSSGPPVGLNCPEGTVPFKDPTTGNWGCWPYTLPTGVGAV